MEWPSSGWTAGRNVERMLTFLWLQGRMVGGARPAVVGPPGRPSAARRRPGRGVGARDGDHGRGAHAARPRRRPPLDIKQYFLREQRRRPGRGAAYSHEGGSRPTRTGGGRPRPPRRGTCTSTPWPSWRLSAPVTGTGAPRCSPPSTTSCWRPAPDRTPVGLRLPQRDVRAEGQTGVGTTCCRSCTRTAWSAVSRPVATGTGAPCWSKASTWSPTLRWWPCARPSPATRRPGRPRGNHRRRVRRDGTRTLARGPLVLGRVLGARTGPGRPRAARRTSAWRAGRRSSRCPP